MALNVCPDCGADVSTEAVACPSCGRPTGKPADKATNLMAVIAVIVIGVVVFGVILALLEGAT